MKQCVFLYPANDIFSVMPFYTGLPVVDILPEKGDSVKVLGWFEEDKSVT
jgi:hypothetical protein